MKIESPERLIEKLSEQVRQKLIIEGPRPDEHRDQNALEN